jgi:hypothetical protein
MTCQITDTIFYDGDVHFLADDPLAMYPKMPEFLALSTANHRGYTAAWAIVVKHLFLISVSGAAEGTFESGIHTVFPMCEAPVRADWFTGSLMLQSGKMLSRCEIDPLYEKETSLFVLRGRVESAHRLHRPTRPPKRDPILNRPVSDLDVASFETIETLKTFKILTIGDLARMNVIDLLRETQLDFSVVAELEFALQTRGLTFSLKEGNSYP